MRALVTGGGGFLGGWIVKLLLERGDAVRVLGRSQYPWLVARGVECVQADLADRDPVVQACEGMDVVFHAGALAGFWGDDAPYFRANVLGTRHVLEGCRRHGVPKLVYTSSPSVAIPPEGCAGVDESVGYPDRYESPYPRSKAQAERELLAADGEGGVHTVALRPHLIWGPGDNHILPRLLQRARSGALAIVGDGENTVDVIYVENAARAHLQAEALLGAGSPLCGRAYFLAQEEPVKLWRFIDQLLGGFGEGPIRKRVPLWLAMGMGFVMETLHRGMDWPGEPRMTRFLAHEFATDHWFDITAARRDLGYRPEDIPTAEGLRRLHASADPTRVPFRDDARGGETTDG